MVPVFFARSGTPLAGVGDAPRISVVASVPADPGWTGPERWFRAPILTSVYGAPRARDEEVLDALFTDAPGWTTFLRENADCIEFFPQMVAQDSNGILARAMPIIAAAGVTLVLDVGGPLGYSEAAGVSGADTGGENGRKSAVFNLTTHFPVLEGYGGTVGIVNLETPWWRCVENGAWKDSGVNFTIEQTAEELVAYCDTILQSRPDVEFILEETPPMYHYDGRPSIQSVLPDSEQMGEWTDLWDETMDQMDAAGITLRGFHADTSREPQFSLPQTVGAQPSVWAPADDWDLRLLKSLRRARAAGMRTGIMFRSYLGTTTSDSDFRTLSLEWARDWKHYTRLLPPEDRLDDIGCVSFQAYPRLIGPETTGDTFAQAYTEVLAVFPEIAAAAGRAAGRVTVTTAPARAIASSPR